MMKTAGDLDDASDDTTQIRKLDLPEAPTVLIVEDDELVLMRLRELVVAAGYKVQSAANGVDALVALQNSSVSIVVTDLTMPGMDGLHLCRRIREHATAGYIYIVLLTVRDNEADVLRGLEAGADDYLSKRTSAAEFTARLGIARRVLALEYSLKVALEKKHELAMTDALTGLFNRRYFARHMSRELARSQRFGGKFSLLLLDIDHFKRVNDTYGHAVGDRVLRNLAQTIRQCLRRTTDWCARLGGEEFAIVLEGISPAEATACAEKVRHAVAIMANGTPAVQITVSIGISSFQGEGNRERVSVQSLLEHADINLYKSKAAGRDRVTSSRLQSVQVESGSDAKTAIRSVR